MNRRQFLQSTSTGFGALALQGILGASDRHAAARIVPKAKNVIFCFMSGGVSAIDSFDPKPRLQKEAGEPLPMKIERTQFNNNGKIFPSPFEFGRYGESGMEISSLFPHVAESADDLCVIRSMTSSVSEHAQGNLLLHTGFPVEGAPSAGAWMSYGLGTANQDLPSFAVLQSGGAVFPHGGVGMFSSGFLPSQHGASILQADRADAVRNVAPAGTQGAQRDRLDLVRHLGRDFAQDQPEVEAAVRNLETAFRMQSSVPELCDLSSESPGTLERYGVHHSNEKLASYAKQALLARRLVERGVRFVELSCLTVGIGAGGAPNPWDQHGDLEKGHRAMAQQVDQPIGALLHDLRARGLLDETLVVWAGEFGRTPFSQGSNGRDHNPFGFSIWMAGGGIKGGQVIGATDEYGYHVASEPYTVWDLWATVQHLLGLDHELLTYRHQGRDVRLTDVHGQPIRAAFA